MDWEVRMSLVYGSRHVQYCETEEEAIAIAARLMGPEGSYKIVNNVVYYTDLPEDWE